MFIIYLFFLNFGDSYYCTGRACENAEIELVYYCCLIYMGNSFSFLCREFVIYIILIPMHYWYINYYQHCQANVLYLSNESIVNLDIVANWN